MALKDWEKYREKGNAIAWFNRKKDLGISIVRFINSIKWSFRVGGKGKKLFKTKSQALAYARSYMRKH